VFAEDLGLLVATLAFPGHEFDEAVEGVAGGEAACGIAHLDVECGCGDSGLYVGFT